jgi:hypothetical protein
MSNSHTTDGTNAIQDITMADVEGTLTDSHTENLNAAGQLNIQMEIEEIDMLLSYSHQGSENMDTSQYDIPENWEEINMEIRKRNRPPKLARSAKFTRSNVI